MHYQIKTHSKLHIGCSILECDQRSSRYTVILYDHRLAAMQCLYIMLIQQAVFVPTHSLITESASVRGMAMDRCVC